MNYRVIDPHEILHVYLSLTLEEAGAYGRLLSIAVASGKPLRTDDTSLARMLGCTLSKWRKLKPEIIGYFAEVDGGMVPRVLLNPGPRTPLSKAVRLAILERDGEVCRYCGTTEGPFDIDHIVPWVRGGTDAEDNLCVACQPCNRSKGARTLEDWLQ